MRVLSVCSGIGAPEVAWQPLGWKPYIMCEVIMKQYCFVPEGVSVKARPRDLTGQRFTHLVAQRCVGKHGSRTLLWECRCDCGTMTVAKASSLTTGKRHSCGCLRSKVKSDWHLINITWNKSKRYQIKGDDEVFRSKKAWTNAAIKKYGNRCQQCGWSEGRCDTHHKVSKKDGGLNTIANAEILCPNCHRVHHEGRRIS